MVKWDFENILQTNFVDLETPKNNMVRFKKEPPIQFLHPIVMNYESPWP